LVNYNTKELTKQTIDSIITNFENNKSFEIIVVDNASTDGSKDMFCTLEKERENFKYIYNNENIGFGKANNLGFKYSKGEYIYILNSDTLLHTKNVDRIIKEKFDRYNKRLAVLATKVQYEDGTLQPSVQKFSNLLAIILRLLKLGQFVRNNAILLRLIKLLPYKPTIVKSYLENFNKEREEGFIEWASGCSLIFRREVYEQLGGFDDNFFMYTEDEEICYRVHQSGYRILYTPDILITHYEGKSNSNRKINEFLLKTKIESEFYYYRKHFPQKLNRLKMTYKTISFIGYPVSNRLRLIREAVKGLTI